MPRTLLIISSILLCITFAETTSLHAGWTINGAPICTTVGDQSLPKVCSDGTGGAIVTWIDRRTSPPSIYAQRINELGRAQWSVNGIPVGSSDYTQDHARIVADGNGGAIIVWEVFQDLVAFDIFAQHIDADGNLLWIETGVAVCTAEANQDWSAICSDGAGGCIIAWVDKRNSSNSDIYAQRIDAGGNPQWTSNGIPICVADSIQKEVQIVSDGSGGAIIVWVDYRVAGDLYGQKVNGSGVEQWTADGARVCLASAIQYEPKIATDGAGGAFVTWYDRRSILFDVYLQRINASGNEVFTSGGIVVCNAVDTQRYPRITADGAGGAIVTWEDFRDQSDKSSLYAQRINASGNRVWPNAQGVPIRTLSGYSTNPVIVSDGMEGAIISWLDSRNQAVSGQDVYVQRIDRLGTCLWRGNGDSLCTAVENQFNLAVTTDGVGGAIVVWEDNRNSNDDIFAQRITIDGDVTATMLQSFTATYNDATIRITWTLAEAGRGMEFFISRRNLSDGRLEEILYPAIVRDGLTFTFNDESFNLGETYSYRIDVVDEDGRCILFETEPITTPAASVRLYQNHPNPFNPQTTIHFSIAEPAHVSLSIYDAAGRLVRVLVDEERKANVYHEVWDGRDRSGNAVTSGMYFYQLRSGSFTGTKKMILLR